MVRHRRSRGHRGGIGGFMPLIHCFLAGAGAATLSEKVIPQVIPYQAPAIGAATGYLLKKNVGGALAGAAGALARDMLKGSISPQGANIGITGY